ncbi:MAG TPA: hypothetical protein VGX92_03500 [Pyrinomonadaceae bacterium]|jgi:hypothetical protein|nr:hypothetical protein [Pyrinomonadaceae bacterium]
MKIVSALIIVTLFWSSAVRAQNKTDRDQNDLIGSVKSVEVYVIDFAMKDEKIEQGERRRWHSTTYNPEGNILERISYDHLGNPAEKLIYTYDARGRNTGYEEYPAILDKTLTIPRKHIYTLDDRGNRVEYKVYESDGTPASRFTYKYDTKGNKIEEGFYYHTGRFGGKIVYAYDERGNQTSQISYNANGTLNWKNVSTFDEKGNRTEWIQYQGRALRYKVISRYDERGRILVNETIEFNAIPNVSISHAPVPGKVVYVYDDEKRTKEVATYEPDGTLKDRVVYTYDAKGNQVGQAMFKADGSPNDPVIQFYDDINEPGSRFRGSLSGKSLIELEYDSDGNWTKKTYLIQSRKDSKPQPYRAEERVITYY